MNSPISLRIAVLTALCIPFTLSAVVPTQKPAGSDAPNGGYFSQYFMNIVESPCPINGFVKSFDTSSANYGRKRCVTLPASNGNAFAGFDTSGNPVWANTWLKSNTNVYYNGGNVGIGTDSPTAKLEVNGSLKISDGSQGTGKVLMSDENGLAKWTKFEGGGNVTKEYVDSRFEEICNMINGLWLKTTTRCVTPTYAWDKAPTGSCSKTCGGGTMSVTVTCKRVDGLIVDDAKCTGTKPATILSCNIIPCRYAVAGQACRGGPSINRTSMTEMPFAFNGEYFIRDKCGISYVTGNFPLQFPEGKKISFDYAYSFYSSEGTFAQNAIGLIQVTFDSSTNILSWQGSATGSTTILYNNTPYYLRAFYQRGPSENNNSNNLSIKLQKEPTNNDIILELTEYVMGYGEEYDYGHTRVDYARVMNITIQ